jgi:hypothetical protein
MPIACALVLSVSVPLAAGGQGRSGVRRHPPHPSQPVVVRGQVFVGGYFYDPIFGPYPWWPRAAYPRLYYPIYDNRSDVRIRVTPEEAEEAAVYVDGFYAGIVDDFNGVFQSLPLTPGGHIILLYLDGWRTVRRHIYLSPGSTFSLRVPLERLPAGVRSEPPEVAPSVPPPPAGSYKTPVTEPKGVTPRRAAEPAAGFGTLDLFVQPVSAEVLIDGERWVTSEDGHFMVQVPAGKHRVEIRKPGYRRFATEIEIRDGEIAPLNVSLNTTRNCAGPI